MSPQMDRRTFLKGAVAGGAGLLILKDSSLAFGSEANDKLNIAIIGVGGKGGGNLGDVSSQNIVALCDVDDRQNPDAYKRFPEAKRFKDYRRMLDKMHKHIDAVVVSTPDHTHAPASLMAMEMGMHCYCEKPLTLTISEARAMAEVARRKNLATQMGNQGTAASGLREAVEIIQAGGLGEVKDVHVWSNRPCWPQGVETPTESQPIPKELDWNLWLGTAPYRPYHSCYLPFGWRGWRDFGTGALGDMGCHTWNLPFMALNMTNPISVDAEVWEETKDSFAKRSIIKYIFPERGKLPPLRFTWYDGGLKPKNEVIGREGNLPGSGCVIIGSKGKLFSPDDYGSSYELYPAGNFEGFVKPEPTLPRTPGHHYEWMEACKGRGKTMSNFDYASALTETILLGVLAMNTHEKVYWDAKGMKAYGCPEADEFITHAYRKF